MASTNWFRRSRPLREPGGGLDTTTFEPEVVATTHRWCRSSGASLRKPCAIGPQTFISSLQSWIRVRYRIDGALKEVLTLPSSMGVGLISRIKIMAGMNIVERRRPQDGQLRTEIDGKEVDVRVATVATIWGEKCVMRLLDRTRSVLRLSELGMPKDAADTYSGFVRAPFGMVLVRARRGAVRQPRSTRR